MEKSEIKNRFRRYGFKRLTIMTYLNGLYRFCKATNLTLEDILTRDLETIEDITEEFIREHEGVLSPKYLNVIYCSVKAWLHVNKRIKGKKHFREIKFDKSSNIENHLLAKALETEDVRLMFILSNRKRKIVLSFAGLSGLRPSLIPYLKVKHIYPEHRTIINGKITLSKPCLIIVPNLVTDTNGIPLRDERGRAIRVTGNKASIPFPSFIPSNTTELLESSLNALPKVTLETPLTTCKNKRQVIHIIKCCYREIGYEGKPYDMRNFGSTILDRLTLMFNDKDLKEYLLGHKPKIGSGLYTLKGLSNEKLTDWTEKYQKACDNWMTEAIFRLSQKNSFSRILVEISRDLGVMDRDLWDLERELEQEKIGREEFKAGIGALINRVQESRVQGLFEKWLDERDARTERKK